MPYEREREVKLECPGLDLIQVFVALEAHLYHNTTGFVAGDVLDAFWKLPQFEKGFTRIRTNNGRPELSIKVEDKGNNLDRIEINSFLTTDFETAVATKNLELGTQVKFLNKRHFTFFLDTNETTSICCYSVAKDGIPINKIFIEIESPDQTLIDTWEKVIIRLFKNTIGAEFKRSPGSLYHMFVE